MSRMCSRDIQGCDMHPSAARAESKERKGFIWYSRCVQIRVSGGSSVSLGLISLQQGQDDRQV